MEHLTGGSEVLCVFTCLLRCDMYETVRWRGVEEELKAVFPLLWGCTEFTARVNQWRRRVTCCHNEAVNVSRTWNH